MESAIERRIRSFQCRLGRRLSYVEAGSGPDLTIVNAYGVTAELWESFIERLARRNRVLIWNLRGFAEGERDLRFTLCDHVADLLEILDHAGSTRSHLLAYCTGAKIALAAYDGFAERVSSLSFVGGHFWPLPDYGPIKSRFLQTLHKVARTVKKRPFTAPVVVSMMTKKIPALPMVKQSLNAISPAYRDIVVAPFSSKESVRTYAHLLVDYAEIDMTPVLDRVNAPTLIIGGPRDVVADPELSAAAAARLPKAEYAVVSDFNHFCMIEAPDRLAEVVGAFLARVEARPGVVEEKNVGVWFKGEVGEDGLSQHLGTRCASGTSQRA